MEKAQQRLRSCENLIKGSLQFFTDCNTSKKIPITRNNQVPLMAPVEHKQNDKNAKNKLTNSSAVIEKLVARTWFDMNQVTIPFKTFD